MRKYISVFISLLCIGFSGFTQQKVELESFGEMKISGRLELRLVGSDSSYMHLNTTAFGMDDMVFGIDDNVLSIKTKSTVSKGQKLKVEIGCTSLKKLQISGASFVYNRDTMSLSVFDLVAKAGSEVDIIIEADSVTCKVNKGAFVRLQGSSSVVVLKTSLGGDYRAVDLNVQNMVAKLNGGTAEVKVSESLDVKANFKSTLRYVEKPKKIVNAEKADERVGLLEEY